MALILFRRECVNVVTLCSSQWRYNKSNGVSNHRRLGYLFKSRRRSRKIPKLRVTGLCKGNSPVTGEFPTQSTSNAEKMFPIDDVIMVSQYCSPARVRVSRSQPPCWEGGRPTLDYYRLNHYLLNAEQITVVRCAYTACGVSNQE